MRMWPAAFSLFALSLLVAPPTALAQEEVPLLSVPQTEGVVETLSIAYPASPEESGGDAAPEPTGPAVWSMSFPRFGSDTLQLRLENIAFDAGDFFQIEISDAAGAVIQRISNDTIGDKRSFWSRLTQGDTIGLAVYGNRGGSLSFEVAAISYDRAGFQIESIIDGDQRQQIYRYDGPLLSALNAVRGSVAQLSFIADTEDGQARFVCTGFLVADDRLLTNEHCIANQETCDNATILFGFAYDRLGQTPGLEQYGCTEVLAADFALDMALLRLDGEPGVRWGIAEFAEEDVADGQTLFVVQHPAGEAQQISADGCTVFEAHSPGREGDTDFAHRCDTLGGSSGSPVFDVEGKVVGLHHWGRTSVGQYANANRAVRAKLVRDAIAAF